MIQYYSWIISLPVGITTRLIPLRPLGMTSEKIYVSINLKAEKEEITMAKEKKELGVDSMGIQKTMTFKDYLGDGIGQLPLNVMSTLVGQLTYFYTEKVGLAAGAVATMLLLAKIADAFSDLVMGKIMDKTKSPKGKARPWFLWMTAPTVAIIILMFTVQNRAGALAQTLNIIGAHGYNMKTLRSRPMKGLQWNYYFYIEAEGNINSENGEMLLRELGAVCARLKLVGVW